MTCFKAALLLLLSSAATHAQQPLTLESYLDQVRRGHSGLRSAAEASAGASLRSREGALLLAPVIFGGVHHVYDKTPRLTPAFQGSRSTFTGYSLGISQLTSFGPKATLSYAVNQNEIFDASPAFMALPRYYDAKPTFELSLPLWRNSFGAETRADQDRIEGQAVATSFEQSFRLKSIVSEAEVAYWRLSAAREAVDIQQRSLERAKAIRDWLSGQVRMQLSDNADLLQAVAAVKVRELELTAALDDERVASTAFNSLRGVDGPGTPERLNRFVSDSLRGMVAPQAKEFRDDVKAAQERSRVASAVARLGLERVSPSLEIFSQLSLNGRDHQLGKASDQSFSKDYPYAVVGVRFSAPLNLSATFDTRAGYRRDQVAAELDYDRRVFEQKQEWLDLNKRLNEAQGRLKLSEEIVAAQKEKLDYERVRHKRGRTTTYQVLLFEQDYAAAELSRVRSASNIVDIIARMKTFGGSAR